MSVRNDVLAVCDWQCCRQSWTYQCLQDMKFAFELVSHWRSMCLSPESSHSRLCGRGIRRSSNVRRGFAQIFCSHKCADITVTHTPPAVRHAPPLWDPACPEWDLTPSQWEPVIFLAIGSRAGSQGLGEVCRRLVDVVLWQLFPGGQQIDFQLSNRLRLWLEFMVLFQHGTLDVIVQWVQIWRVSGPLLIFNERRTVCLQTILHVPCELGRDLAGRWSLRERESCGSGWSFHRRQKCRHTVFVVENLKVIGVGPFL